MKKFAIALYIGALIFSTPVYLYAQDGIETLKNIVPPDFSAVNEHGDSILYRFIQTDSNSVAVSLMMNDSALYKTDSLVIPDTVVYNQKKYPVKQIMWWAFAYHPKHVSSITLPRTYEGICMDYSSNISVIHLFHPLTLATSFQHIYVDARNPYFMTREGVLYTKDKKGVYAYPPLNSSSYYAIEEGVEYIGEQAFLWAQNLDTLETPLSLKRIKEQGVSRSKIKEIILKDSIEYLDEFAFLNMDSLKKLILGKGMISINSETFYVYGDPQKTRLDLLCYASTPPTILSSESYHGQDVLVGTEYINLYVPRQSLKLYQQAAGWKDCASILPIEPPIVVGVDTAEVSWVQNFSATGYMWTLYLDEAKTQRFMSLTFDANGHLTHIDINSSHMPERMPALYSEESETEKHFAEYYSFTISGLSPETTYYYTRQSLKGTEVIDEETGSFETQSNEATGLNGYESVTPTPQKFIENGQVYINDGNVTYNVEGAIIGK